MAKILTSQDIDRIARKAQQQKQDEENPLTADDIPVTPLGWMLLVVPLEAKQETEGGIIIADQAREVEEIQNTIGQVVKMGSLCYTGTTESGIKLANEERKVEVGDYVLFARYTGQKVKIRYGAKDRTVILLSDTDILAHVTDPDKIRHWL
jgi:co-chaperonin GroES (HSP10)